MGRDKVNKKRKLFKGIAKILIEHKIISTQNGMKAQTLLDLLCKLKDIALPSNISEASSYITLRDFLINKNVLPPLLPPGQSTKVRKFKVRKSAQARLVTPDMDKSKVADLYRADLTKFATAPERRVKRLLFDINKNIQRLWFIFQYPWTDTPGKEFYISDFYFPDIKLTMEIDGNSHDDQNQIDKDNRKTQHLLSKGIKTIRITNSQCYHIDAQFLLNLLLSNRKN